MYISRKDIDGRCILMSLGERLKELRKREKLTQQELAQQIGCSHQTISKYEKDENMEKIKVISSLSDFFGVSTDQLIKGTVSKKLGEISVDEERFLNKYRNLSTHDREIVNYILNMNNSSELQKPQIIYIEKSVRSVRMKLQSVSAGYGEIIDDTSEHEENFPTNIVPDNTSYGVRVNGDSMEPTIMNGQIIWVEERKDRLPNGSIGIFNTIQGQVCKKFYQDGYDGTITLVSQNEKYENIVIDNPDFYDIMQGRVIGWCDDPKK